MAEQEKLGKDVEKSEPAGAPTGAKAVERRTYVAPSLRALGSVRELTWGATGPGSDATDQHT